MKKWFWGWWSFLLDKSTFYCRLLKIYFERKILSQVLLGTLPLVSLWGDIQEQSGRNTFIFTAGVSVQFICSAVSDSLQPRGLQHARLPCQSPTPGAYSNSCLLKLMSIESVMPSNHLILCHPLLLLSSIFPRIRVFSNGGSWLFCWSLDGMMLRMPPKEE